MAEVAHVAGDHRELMHLGDGGDHRVFVEGVGLAMHQLSPAAECRAIHGENVEGVAHLIEPALDRIGFCRALIAAEFDPGLDLAAGHAGEIELGVLNALNPGDPTAVGPCPTAPSQAGGGHHHGLVLAPPSGHPGPATAA